MLFVTDKQTFEDLNLIGRKDSIYNFFNKTVTSHGATKLHEMFSNPLSNEADINYRSNLIRSLASSKINFPFDSESIDLIELYISNADGRSLVSDNKSVFQQKLALLTTVDTDYQIIYKGIVALTDLVHTLKIFLSTSLRGNNCIFKGDTEAIMIEECLISGPLKELLSEDPKFKFSYDKIAKLDELVRLKNIKTLRKILDYIYNLDIYISVGKLAFEHNYTFPVALPEEQHLTVIEGFYHPQLKGAVTNTISLSPENNVVFLTGANMAGKSTFMKSLGITMFLAHMGFPVAAKHMRFSVLNGIYTTINLPDNLGIGASHFYAEVLRIKKIANELKTRKLFVIFDELFRGTNVKDAYDATIAITTELAKKQNSIFIISTHIIEAGEVLKERCKSICFKYLPTKMNMNVPEYTYQLTDGITSDRHGMVIVNNEGIIEILKNGKKKLIQL